MASLFPHNIVTALLDCGFQADKQAREKLVNQTIVDENDYTSNFTCLLGLAINALKIHALTSTVQKLNATRERALGADGCIIFQNLELGIMKVGIFEAKWPRLSNALYKWDSLVNGKSHFHDQMQRQAQYVQDFAIWEMFYLEHPFYQQPAFMPPEGSACAWHSDTYSASQNRPDQSKPWQSAELLKMLEGDFLAISDIFEEIFACRRGVQLPITSPELLFQTGISPEEVVIIKYRQM